MARIVNMPNREARMVEIYAVKYEDRRLEGKVEALFRSRASADGFAERYGSEVEPRRVTLKEFSALRRQHRL